MTFARSLLDPHLANAAIPGLGLLVLTACAVPHSSAPAHTAPLLAPTRPAATSASASAPIAAGASSGPSVSEAPEVSRQQERHDAVDRLLDGALTRAEAACSDHIADEREPCVDALLDEHARSLDRAMERSMRGLTLLAGYGEARCRHVSGPAARTDCKNGAMNQLLVELGRECASGTETEQQDCTLQKVIERLDPRASRQR
jgi:hypothetical protein